MNKKFYLSALLMACTLSLSAEEVITDTTLMTFNMMGAMPYYRVNYTYESVAPDGVTPVTLSSALFFPQRIFERTAMLEIAGKEFNASGLVLNNHFTITKRDEAPTVNSNPLIEGPFATLGPSLIIVSPDSYGFGVTDDKPQAYLIADATAINHIDAVGAARRLLKKMGYSVADLFAQFGYSQGGHSSMAVQRYFDTHEVDPEVISRIDYTLCGDGPYDLNAMMDTLLIPEATFPYPCGISLIVEGQIEGANLDISYSDIFHAPLDTKLIEWNDSKALTTRSARCCAPTTSRVPTPQWIPTSRLFTTTPSATTGRPIPTPASSSIIQPTTRWCLTSTWSICATSCVTSAASATTSSKPIPPKADTSMQPCSSS